MKFWPEFNLKWMPENNQICQDLIWQMMKKYPNSSYKLNEKFYEKASQSKLEIHYNFLL